MRAGLETLSVVESENLLDNAAKVGAYMKSEFEKAFAGNPGVKEVRGEGLMLGIELAKPAGDVLKLAMEKGLLLSVTADTVVRLVPPLIITQAEAAEIVSILVPIINNFVKN